MLDEGAKQVQSELKNEPAVKARLLRVRPGVSGDGNFCARGFTGEIVRIHGEQRGLVQSEKGKSAAFLVSVDSNWSGERGAHRFLFLA